MDIMAILSPVLLCVGAIAGVAIVYFAGALLRDRLRERRERGARR